ncbi:MAG: GH3 auxin-responsive promoter family protein [Treponema sp.]|nr:GH3 auxin-responsive promoter family protein [Treponema sp.]
MAKLPNKPKKLWLINFALGFVGKKQYKLVKKASKNCKNTEAQTLRNILDYAKDSEWGKAHNFADILAATTDEELFALWQKNVPPADYEDFRPFVERHKNGEENILFPGKPKMYATTSGTTKEPKWIPITNEYYDNVYSKMTKLWLYTFMMHRPHCFEGPALSIVGKDIEGYAPDGTVYGSVSGVTRRDIPDFIKCIHSAPADVFSISDYTARYYTLMRIGIEQDVHVIVTANPSTIVEMQNNVNEYFDDYVKDIENGTLNESLDISPEIRAALAPVFKPNPARAAELRELKAKYGNVLPKHYWPRLCILTTWKCGNTKVYMDKFQGSFSEDTLHQEFSYFSSECRTGLVLNGQNDTVLFPHMHYFEFISEEDLENPNPKFLQLHELEVGKRYSIYVTTFAGLYRYNMNDLIEVTGKFGTIPTIQFIQKINGIISMTGEKLHERQFIEAVGLAEEETGINTAFFVGFADVQNSVYHIYYEFKNKISDEDVKKFNDCVDAKLKSVNIEYEAKRDSLRVKDPIAHVLQEDSFAKFKEECLKKGFRDGQFKLNLLMQDEKRHAMFKELVIK